MPRIRLAPDHEISRVIRGGWQLATGHGQLRGADPVGDMVAFADAGITTFDCADIYTGVEELIGRFRLRYRELRGAEALSRIKVHTKFVPDLDVLPTISKGYVQGVIEQSLRRLNLERLDLVQFHWWDYTAPKWLETAHWLDELREAGKINKVSLTNFDTEHMLAMVTGGIPITSHQLQYSLLDSRPAQRMVAAAAEHNVALATTDGRWLPRKQMLQLAERPTADFRYVRLMGADRSLVDYSRIQVDRTRELELWANTLSSVGSALDTYVYINNHFAGHSPQSARDLQRMLGQPATEPEQIGEQMSLF